jgi:amidase
MAAVPDAPRTAFSGPETTRMTALEVVTALRDGQISAAELITDSLTRMSQTSPAINAMVTPCAERALNAAKTAPRDSVLAGLPIGIKDLTPVEGVRTTWGTVGLSDFIPTASDPLVTRMESRGGVVLGKTNSPEMGAGANTFNAVFGATRNPWNTDMNAGGSSGGAAAGLATGEVWLSHGSDLGGSLRTPASFCRMVGLRPSPGIAGGNGGDGFDTMPVQGPMARNVTDCALFLDAMAGHDPQWPVSFPAAPGGYLSAALADPAPLTIGFTPDFNGQAPVTPEMATLLRNALEQISGDGITLRDSAPMLDGFEACFRTLRALGFWVQARQTPERITQHYKPALQQNIAEGRALQVDDIAAAIAKRSALYQEALAWFTKGHDILAAPVTGLPPLPVEVEFPPQVPGVASRDYLSWLVFAMPATLCSLPALSLPVGFTDSGLPVGIQLIGKPRGEAALLHAARMIEQRLDLDLAPIDPITPGDTGSRRG